MPLTISHYPTEHKTLSTGSAIKCATTGKKFAPLSAIILDLFGFHIYIHAKRALSAHAIPIFIFIAGNAGNLTHRFFPESMGGGGNLSPKIDAETFCLGKKVDEGTNQGTDQNPTFNSSGDLEIESFLDFMTSNSERSVLFIPFMSAFWPKQETQLDDFVDALILCHASPVGVVSTALLQKIKASGVGMAPAWAPPGGSLEALICWPFQTDEPVAAVHLMQN
ncbi:hypothetical protein K438DRAFT_1969042 [Mycena galopus ATCC 62051]|nr:hypothetical protein K438DRAFT_1969042 [Mycena galopus ATCC 62051]